MKNIFLYSIVFLCFGSCSKDENKEFPHLILNYAYNIDFIEIFEISGETNTCNLVLKGQDAIYKGINDNCHNKFANRFNDVRFSGKSSLTSPFMIDTIVSIDVFCNRKIDLEHPEGSNLNKIVMITSISCKELLEGHYSLTNPITTTEYIDSFNKRVNKVLLGTDFILKLPTPLENGKYDFRILVNLKNGEPLEISYSKIFN